MTNPTTHFCRLSIAVLLAVLAVSVAAKAQILPPSEGPVVRDIVIQYVGPASISKERILSNMKTAVGQPYSELNVEEDIRSIYRTQEVGNVRIFSEPMGDGVRVVVVLQTRSTVSEVILAGVDKAKANRLRKQINTKPGASLNEETIEKDRATIIEYYQQRGFGNVSVTTSIQANEQAGTSRVVFNIDEGGRAIVRKVRFEGVTAASEKEMRKQIKTRGKDWLSFFNKSGRLEDDVLDEDIVKVEEFLSGKGHIDAKVLEVRRDRVDDRRIDLVFVVSEGPQYTVSSLSFEGNQLFTTDELVSAIKMQPGSVYSPQGLRADSRIVQDMYGAKGYVDLLLVPEAASSGNATVKLTYRIDEGFQSYVEQINIEGNTKTKDKVIRRELAIVPGEIFDTTAVETSKQRLQNLGYFERVETYPNDTLIPGRKDLNIVVQEKRTGSFNFGAGFSSIDSLIGFAELTQGNFDLMNWPRFTGGGQKFRTRVQLGTERQDFVIGLTEPWFLDRQLSLGGELFYRELNFVSDVYDQTNIGGTAKLIKPLGEFSSVEFNYTLQQVEIGGFEGRVSDAIRSEGGERIESKLGSVILYDTRDSVFLTRKGERIEFELYGAGGPLSGDVDYYGWRIEASKYWSLPWDGIFLVNGELAVVDSGDPVPIWARQYLGGSNNLRGYDFRDVGPKDEFGEPLGGNTMARLTLEYTIPVIERVRAAFFYDVGFVAEDAYDWNTDTYGMDVGIGLRLDLPIGPVRIDFGYPLQTDRFNDSSGKFNFNVGYQF